MSRHRDPDAAVGAVPLTAPATPWNRAISPHRSMSFTRVSLADVKRIKNHLGCTVNDVVLGLMGGTLRRYLEAQDAQPEAPLVAVCPVSVRTDEDTSQLQQQGVGDVHQRWPPMSTTRSSACASSTR